MLSDLQYSRFNELAWREYECLVREFIEQHNAEKDHFALTGTLGEHDFMIGPDGEKVKIPEFYWKTICFNENGTTWSVALIAKNLNSEDTARSEAFMSLQKFSETYLNGKAVYGPACQNAGLGPWEKVLENFSQFKTSLNCTFAVTDNKRL